MTVWAGALVVVAAGATLLFAPAANAGSTSQTWNTEDSYRASRDFLPSGKTWVGTMGCTGDDAVFSESDLVQTSNHKVVLDNGNAFRTIDGAWHWENYVTTKSGTAYYMRWYGGNKNANGAIEYGAEAWCQGVEAEW